MSKFKLRNNMLWQQSSWGIQLYYAKADRVISRKIKLQNVQIDACDTSGLLSHLSECNME